MTKRDELYALLDHVPSPVIRAFTEFTLSQAPWTFWQRPSSAGKHHPPDEHGHEGLLLHTIRVVKVGLVICDSADGRLDPNVIIPACVLHDICRYGIGVVHGGADERYSVREHPDLAATLIRRLGNGSGSFVEDIACAVETHTGRWGRIQPRNETEWAVHYADNIASTVHRWAGLDKSLDL